MARIDAEGKLVTLVVMMHVDPELIDEKIQHVRELAYQHSKRPGFVSCSIHKSLDNSKLVEYIQWETPEHLQAMRKSFQSESPQPPDFAKRIDWGIMNVVEVVEAPLTVKH
jgi:quinol monooxygenase YgiN